MSTFAHASIFLGISTTDKSLVEKIETMFAGENRLYDDENGHEVESLYDNQDSTIGCGIELAEVSYKSEWPEIISLEEITAKATEKRPLLEALLSQHGIDEKPVVLLQARYI